MSLIFTAISPHLSRLGGHDSIYHDALKKALDQIGVEYVGKKTLCLTEKSESPRIFFLESFTSRQFLKIALRSFFSLQKSDALWLLFRYGKHQLPLKGRGHQFLIGLLKWRFKHRFVGLTDSQIIGKEFALDLLPIPHTTVYGKESESLICWWPGPPRKEKGLEIIRKIAPIRGRFKLALSKEAGIECDYPLEPELSHVDYRSWMEKSRIILLPYDRSTYQSGTSGIFVEAVVGGKLPLVSDGSWLAQELRRFNLESLIVDWDDSDFFLRVEEKLHDETIQTHLKNMQRAYASFHCCETYGKELKKWIKYSQTGCF
ncbi:MAG: hypothetical protein S4CHLAM45_01920 [Chlamydiales bacterium]|nr:hypothetical protein [Chlamydiales bacterium]MCH9619511.1 hypothetical protein [Chlamydiales bacterium]MCH9622315.1 hypothetical protein [Chlamydiales bacterium]